MANNIAFQPMGKTYPINVTSNATIYSVTVNADSPCNQYMITNASATETVFVRVDGEVLIPFPDEEYAIPILPGNYVVLTGAQTSNVKDVIVSAVTISNATVVFVTPGEGLK